MKMKYGETVKVEFLEGNAAFLNRIYADNETYRSNLNALVGLIYTLRPRVFDKMKLSYKLGINDLAQWSSVLHQTKDHFEKLTKSVIKRDTQDLQDTVVTDIIENVENMYPWMKKNVLISSDMMDTFQLNIGGNISTKEPFSRDKSREFAKENGRIHDHGNRAKPLFYNFSFLPNEEIFSEELDVIVENFEIPIFDASYVYFYINKFCLPEMNEIFGINKLIAFVEEANKEDTDKVSIAQFGSVFGMTTLLKMFGERKNEVEQVILKKVSEGVDEKKMKDVKMHFF